MAELVRARTDSGDEVNVSKSIAERNDMEILDESPWKAFNAPRRNARKNGRPAKKRTSVSAEAAKKKASAEVLEKVESS